MKRADAFVPQQAWCIIMRLCREWNGGLHEGGRKGKGIEVMMHSHTTFPSGTSESALNEGALKQPEGRALSRKGNRR
jgi:hypothetical protein